MDEELSNTVSDGLAALESTSFGRLASVLGHVGGNQVGQLAHLQITAECLVNSPIFASDPEWIGILINCSS